jgi:hypothetical protein
MNEMTYEEFIRLPAIIDVKRKSVKRMQKRN